MSISILKIDIIEHKLKIRYSGQLKYCITHVTIIAFKISQNLLLVIQMAQSSRITNKDCSLK
jgi:hypothetical protein